MHVPNISYNRSTSGALKRAQTPRRHEGSTCKDNSFSVSRFSISNPPSDNPGYGPVLYNQIAIQPQHIKSCNQSPTHHPIGVGLRAQPGLSGHLTLTSIIQLPYTNTPTSFRR